MKLNKVASIIKKNKRLVIYTASNGAQWISNGMAAYSMAGMPHLTKEIVLKIFDVPQDKQGGWICTETELPSGIDFESAIQQEREIEPMKIFIDWMGDVYWLFKDGKQIYTIKEEFIKPFSDNQEYITYFRREMHGGHFVLAIKNGLTLEAIITPHYLHKYEDFTKEIKEIAALYAKMPKDGAGIFEPTIENQTEPPEILDSGENDGGKQIHLV